MARQRYFGAGDELHLAFDLPASSDGEAARDGLGPDQAIVVRRT